MGDLGLPLGPMWAILGRSWASVGGPAALLGPLWAVLGRSWVLLGGPGALLASLWAVLGRSWGHCGQSWAALGALGKLKDAIFSEKIGFSEKCFFLEREHEK